jgi:hypothetical protein
MRIYRKTACPRTTSAAGDASSPTPHAPEQRQRRTSASGYAASSRHYQHDDAPRAADYSEYSKTWGFFVQDDWRANDKLTVNVGLRYEIETPLTERNDKSVSGFEFDYVQPIEGTVQARYAALNDPALKALVPQLTARGGLMFAGVDGSSRLYDSPGNTFLPRVGFAYKAGSRTVIRGGVGLFAGFLGQRRVMSPERLRPDDHHGMTTNPFGALIPRDIGRPCSPADPGAGGDPPGPADQPRTEHLVLQPGPRGVQAAPLADRVPAPVAG